MIPLLQSPTVQEITGIDGERGGGSGEMLALLQGLIEDDRPQARKDVQ